MATSNFMMQHIIGGLIMKSLTFSTALTTAVLAFASNGMASIDPMEDIPSMASSPALNRVVVLESMLEEALNEMTIIVSSGPNTDLMQMHHYNCACASGSAFFGTAGGIGGAAAGGAITGGLGGQMIGGGVGAVIGEQIHQGIHSMGELGPWDGNPPAGGQMWLHE